ncbi:hypothetical protein HL653_09015 [Sphingomonas sp. AP4-R1]|uniref:hypothetical protein n=1 Tax=Sphingomonas sp. AP4-R1 TaxID=2735134 RepID=UPI001493AB42|nr:hypothetical protein [Sphingomonas sp. AP4-R1]QJU57913.1 hypothetical protein HL653_09015 [Sphingomonas sp. AP4-R1]
MTHRFDRFDRFACIDWSGAVGDRLKGIAIATCKAGEEAPSLVIPPRGRWSRQEVLDWLIAQAPRRMLIGLDLSPSLPFADEGAFLPGEGTAPADARALWAYVEAGSAGQAHHAVSHFVADHAAHFRIGMRTGARFRTAGNGRMRATEVAARAQGVRPYSCFNLVGASQVGRSSLTGMRVLHALDGRIPFWPFDPVPEEDALLVEIYTSIAARRAGVTGGTKLRSIEALNRALTAPAIASAPVPGAGAIDDHSGDALLTAAWLRRAAVDPDLWHPHDLEPVRDTEGWTFGVR